MKTQKILNIAIGALVLSLLAFSVAALAGGVARGSNVSNGINGINGSNGEQTADKNGPAWHAIWHYNPTSAKEAYALGSAAVVATVLRVEQAQDIVVPASGEPEGVDRIPNQTVTLRVNEVLKGQVGKTLKLFHTGTDERFADGDPAYRAGEKYVLFVLPRDDGRWVLVSPEGRYSLENNTMRPISEKPGVAEVSGMSLDSFRALLKGSDANANK